MIVRELVTRLGFQVEQSKLTQFDRSIGAIRNKLSGTSANLNKIADSFIGLGGRLSLFVTAPLVGLNVAMIKVASNMEQLGISFEVMLGSAEKGNALIQEMFEFAKNTPFEIRNIGPVVKQLLAMGIESDKVIKTLGFLGDVASGLDVPIERLALNLGQVKAQGRLTGRELRDFAIAGVPLLAELAKITGKSKKEILAMISAGEVNYDMVEKAFKSMTSEGGKFFNLMERQSKTLGGLFSNFMDNLYLTAGAIGEVIVEAFELKRVIGFLNKVMDKALGIFKGLERPVQIFILSIGLMVTLIGPLLLVMGGLIKTILFLKNALILMRTALHFATLAGLQFNIALFALPALILAVVVALGLLVDDIIGWVKGQDSLIGDVLGPWEHWKDSMLEFFGMVKRGFKDLLSGDIDRLIEKGKLLAKTFGFFLEDLGVSEESLAQAENFFKELEKKDPSKIDRIVDRNLSPSQRRDQMFLAGTSARKSGAVNSNTFNTTVNATVNANTNASASDIALEVGDVVGARIQKEIKDTININQEN